MSIELNIETRHEQKRGCGFRKQGGLYMVSGSEGISVSCLPIEMCVCPACNQGIKPSRSFQWITPHDLFPTINDCMTGSAPIGCSAPSHSCYVHEAMEGKQGLMWVGDKFYSPESFQEESSRMGISKRIPAVPNDFEVGNHWIFLGHRKAVTEFVPCDCKGQDPDCEQKDCLNGLIRQEKPGVFTIFKPTAIEYVVHPDDDEKKLANMQKRGITLVNVIPIKDQQEMDLCK